MREKSDLDNAILEAQARFESAVSFMEKAGLDVSELWEELRQIRMDHEGCLATRDAVLRVVGLIDALTERAKQAAGTPPPAPPPPPPPGLKSIYLNIHEAILSNAAAGRDVTELASRFLDLRRREINNRCGRPDARLVSNFFERQAHDLYLEAVKAGGWAMSPLTEAARNFDRATEVLGDLRSKVEKACDMTLVPSALTRLIALQGEALLVLRPSSDVAERGAKGIRLDRVIEEARGLIKSIDTACEAKIRSASAEAEVASAALSVLRRLKANPRPSPAELAGLSEVAESIVALSESLGKAREEMPEHGASSEETAKIATRAKNLGQYVETLARLGHETPEPVDGTFEAFFDLVRFVEPPGSRAFSAAAKEDVYEAAFVTAGGVLVEIAHHPKLAPDDDSRWTLSVGRQISSSGPTFSSVSSRLVFGYRKDLEAVCSAISIFDYGRDDGDGEDLGEEGKDS